MNKRDRLVQVTCIERLDDNASTFDTLTKDIQFGRADRAVYEMASWNAVSDRDPFTYEDILKAANDFNERIVFDNGTHLMTANNVMIVLYMYKPIEVKDRLGNDLELGEQVIWVNPDLGERDLNMIWTIFDVQSEELVKIHDMYLGYEVNPNELISVKALNLL